MYLVRAQRIDDCVEILSSPKHWLEAYHVRIQIPASTHPHNRIYQAPPASYKPENKNLYYIHYLLPKEKYQEKYTISFH